VRFNSKLFFVILFALLAASRFCHLGILWTEENLPMAAAQQMVEGKTLYRDAWFDKPPLIAAFYVPLGATPEWTLRLAGALYALLVCWIAYRFASDLWSPSEGAWAGALAGFFLIFDLPSAVIPIASDLLMLAPHLAAVWLAWKRKPFWSGALAAIAFWVSPKGVFVAAACALWNPAGLPLLDEVPSSLGQQDLPFSCNFCERRQHRAEHFANRRDVIAGDPLPQFDQFGSKRGNQVDDFADFANCSVFGNCAGEFRDDTDKRFLAERNQHARADLYLLPQAFRRSVSEGRAQRHRQRYVAKGSAHSVWIILGVCGQPQKAVPTTLTLISEAGKSRQSTTLTTNQHNARENCRDAQPLEAGHFFFQEERC